MRRLRLLAIALMTALTTAVSAAADDDTRYAALLIVPDTGEVLHARHADELRHPASLTKLMTLYLVFEDIRDGKLGFGDRLRVSANAAAQPPVKLGLAEGDSMRVLDALKAVIVHSANDAAVVLAERLEGDEDAFARRMNATARDLGMTRTRFTNASGLPNPDQVTTVRDLARLAVALQTEFPEYYPLFQVRNLHWNDRVIRSHNAILDMVDGANGLKTGYTDASGYNLAASATRGDASLVAIVMGGPDAPTRDAHTALLLDRGFEALAERGAPAAPQSEPEARLIAVSDTTSGDSRRLRIILDDDATLDDAAYVRPSDPVAPVTSAPLEPLAPSADPSASAMATDSGWRVQVGAFNEPERARARLAELRPIVAGGDAAPIQLVTPVEDVAPPMWRARFGGYADRAAAETACARLKAAERSCFVVNAHES